MLVVGLMPAAALAESDAPEAAQTDEQAAPAESGVSEEPSANEEASANEETPAADDTSKATQSNDKTAADKPVAAEKDGAATSKDTEEETSAALNEEGEEASDEGDLSAHALVTIDSVSNLRMDGSASSATLSNGAYANFSFSWSTYITAEGQAAFCRNNKITFDTNIGTLFEFVEPVNQDVRDPNTGLIIGTLSITADKVTITFNENIEPMQASQYGGYCSTSGSIFKAKPIQTTATDLVKTLVIGDASLDIKWVGLKKNVKPVIHGNGSISPGIIQTISDDSSQTFTIKPADGETVESVSLIKPDGTEVPIESVPEAGGTYTINGTDLDLGYTQLVATFTTKNLNGVNDSALIKQDWQAAVGDTARLNIFAGGDEITSLYKNQGSSIDSEKQKEAFIIEDTLPGQAAFEGITIKAVLPDWAQKDGVLVPVQDKGGFEHNFSADMTGYMTKLTQYYNINNVPGNNESYSDFKNRILAIPMSWGVYVDSENNSTLIINFGSPASPNVGTPKYSDLFGGRLAADPTLNAIAGDNNCVKGKVQYFAINYYAKHWFSNSVNEVFENSVKSEFSDGNNTPYSPSSSAQYTINTSSSFSSGAVGHLRVNMRDAADLGKGLENAQFKLQIKNASNKWVDYTGDTVSGSTDASGLLDLSSLIVGEYKLVETKAPTGYSANTAVFSTLPGSATSINSDGTFRVASGDLIGATGFGAVVTNKKTSYKVTYDKNGGVEVSGTVEDYNSPYVVDEMWTVLSAENILTWEGHRFSGWNTEPDGSGKRYPVGATYMMSKDVYLYAQWTPLTKSDELADVPLTATVSGTDTPSIEEYTFKMVGEGQAPMPDGVTDGTATVKRVGVGDADFGSIMYAAAGTYTYKIYETAGTTANMEYDSDVYKMTVVVTKDETSGALKAVRTFSKAGATVDKIVFNNKNITSADIATKKVADKVSAQPGQEIKYTITVTNPGKAKAIGAWVKDTVPAGTTFVSCDAAGVVSDDQKYVNWFAAELGPGNDAALTFTMTVKVNSDVAEGTQITNTAKYEITGTTDMPDFTLDPNGSDTPTAGTKVKKESSNNGNNNGGNNGNGNGTNDGDSTSNVDNATNGKLVLTSDDMLLMALSFAGILLVAAGAIVAIRRRQRN